MQALYGGSFQNIKKDYQINGQLYLFMAENTQYGKNTNTF